MRGTLRGRSPHNEASLRVASAPSFVATRDYEPITWSRERETSPSLQRAVLLAACGVVRRANDDGSWGGRVQGDAGQSARFLLTLIALDEIAGGRAEQLAQQLLDSQLPTGGWPAAPGGEADLSISVLAYLAIKRLRGPGALPCLTVSRRAILANGGLEAISNEANAWLALFGEAELRENAEDLPWSRAVAWRSCPAPDGLHSVRELRSLQPVDRGDAEVARLTPLAELLWNRLAVNQESDAAAIDRLESDIDSLVSEDDETGCLTIALEATPEWDTAIAVEMLVKSGRADDAARGAAWLAACAARVAAGGDAALLATVLRGLAVWSHSSATVCGSLPPNLRVVDSVAFEPCESVDPANDATVGKAIETLRRSLLASQGEEGGWGADDTTAFAVEALSLVDSDATQDAIDRGVACLLDRQQADGSWRSSLATDDLYATSRAVLALVAADQKRGEADCEARLAGVNWILAGQSASGGWGEEVNPAGETTLAAAASRTTWALAALTAAGQQHSEACGNAVRFLLDTQSEDGEWCEPHFVLRSSGAAACRNDLRPTVEVATGIAAWASISRQNPPASEPKTCLRLVRHDTVAS